MSKDLRINESVLSKSFKSEISRSMSIPSNFPAAERVVSESARVELSSVDLENAYVVVNGVIRTTIYYASIDDPADVRSLRRNFEFKERISVSSARRGLDLDAEILIADMKFSLRNNRIINLTFIIISDLAISRRDRVAFIDEREDMALRRREMRVQRSFRESNFKRILQDTVRLPTTASDIRRVVDIDTSIQVTEISTGYDTIRVRGIVKTDLLYINSSGQVEYSDFMYSFNETFAFRGVNPNMDAFVEFNIIDESASRVDSRRVKLRTELIFHILVLEEDIIDIPTDILKPDAVFPVRRPVIVEQVVAEQRSRISARNRVTLQEGKADVDKVISANGIIRGGSTVVSVENRGVAVSGVIDANVIYVGDLPQQPVFHTSATITFDSFINIPEVRAGMQAYSEISINRITATRISNRVIEVRAVVNIDLLVTERVQVPVVTGITDKPARRPVAKERPIHRPAREETVEYTVRSGDTLYRIAQHYSVTVESIIALNPSIDPNNLQVGQRLLIPKR